MAVRIAVIDSGIDASVSDLKRYVSTNKSYGLDKAGRIGEQPGTQSRHVHATIIGLIIRSLCQDIELVSINILDEKLQADGRELLYALKASLEFGVNIVHLSLGTKDKRYIPGFNRLIRKAVRKNILVIAAAHNDNGICYPAFLKHVWRVKSLGLAPFDGYVYADGSFWASYAAKNIPGVAEKEMKEIIGNSIAAAYITGHAARIISGERTTDRKTIERVMQQNPVRVLQNFKDVQHKKLHFNWEPVPPGTIKQ